MLWRLSACLFETLFPLSLYHLWCKTYSDTNKHCKRMACKHSPLTKS